MQPERALQMDIHFLSLTDSVIIVLFIGQLLLLMQQNSFLLSRIIVNCGHVLSFPQNPP